MPTWARPAPNSGFYSETASPADAIAVHSVDVSWSQLRPTPATRIDRTSTGSAHGMSFDSLDTQLADSGPFWMRLFASGVDWAPTWVVEQCAVTPLGPDDDGQLHLPIWDECVWGHLLNTYRLLFVDQGLASDARLRFVYVPGAFAWAEYDYDMVTAAVATGSLTQQQYLGWYAHALPDLVELFGDDASKLVFTGEDYPWGPFGAADDLLASQAVDAGMGIRTGITELSNFHLSHAPAYASTVQPNGHLLVDDAAPIHDGTRVVAVENECFTNCGYTTNDVAYAVRQANLKALQLRANWMYIVPDTSYLDALREHWDWVRLSLGQRAESSPDAWVALRDAEDTSWEEDEVGVFADPARWPTRPWVRNLERWLVQVDEPGSVAHRTEVDPHREVLAPQNGTAFEGLRTAVAAGDTGFVFTVDPSFAASATDSGTRLVMKITFLDTGTGAFAVDTAAGTSPSVERTDTGRWRTATLALPDGALVGPAGAAPRVRLTLADGADDLAVRFVRLIRLDG